MNGKVILGIILGVGLVFTVAIMMPISENSLPPTNAYSRIMINGQIYQADSYNDMLVLGDGFAMENNTINTNVSTPDSWLNIIPNGVTITANSPNDTLMINTTGSIAATVTGDTIIIKLKPISCPILQAIKSVDSNGNFVCGAL